MTGGPSVAAPPGNPRGPPKVDVHAASFLLGRVSARDRSRGRASARAARGGGLPAPPARAGGAADGRGDDEARGGAADGRGDDEARGQGETSQSSAGWRGRRWTGRRRGPRPRPDQPIECRRGDGPQYGGRVHRRRQTTCVRAVPIRLLSLHGAPEAKRARHRARILLQQVLRALDESTVGSQEGLLALQELLWEDGRAPENGYDEGCSSPQGAPQPAARIRGGSRGSQRGASGTRKWHR